MRNIWNFKTGAHVSFQTTNRVCKYFERTCFTFVSQKTVIHRSPVIVKHRIWQNFRIVSRLFHENGKSNFKLLIFCSCNSRSVGFPVFVKQMWNKIFCTFHPEIYVFLFYFYCGFSLWAEWVTSFFVAPNFKEGT